jgi:hypothetical protein
MSKYNLIFLYDSVQYFVPFIENRGFKVFRPYKKLSLIGRAFRKISLKTNLFTNYWYGDWKGILNEVENIIVFASDRIDHIEYIKRNFPHIRIILWYWNPAYRCFNPLHIPHGLCEKWTFDLEDSINYNMTHNTTFYFKEIPQQLNVKYLHDGDVLFVGANKGRREGLMEFGNVLKSLGKSFNFHIVPDKHEENFEKIQPIPYSSYLKMLTEYNIILDYMQEGQSGLTLRVMESLFFNKKLITNDVQIQKQSFYDKNNIFIIGIDDENDLIHFFNTPYKLIDVKIKNNFDFEAWLNRFNFNERTN